MLVLVLLRFTRTFSCAYACACAHAYASVVRVKPALSDSLAWIINSSACSYGVIRDHFYFRISAFSCAWLLKVNKYYSCQPVANPLGVGLFTRYQYIRNMRFAGALQLWSLAWSREIETWMGDQLLKRIAVAMFSSFSAAPFDRSQAIFLLFTLMPPGGWNCWLKFKFRRQISRSRSRVVLRFSVPQY